MDVSGMTLEGFFLADYDRMRERITEWVRLPVDADGVPIHVGDVMWQKDRITKRACKAIMGDMLRHMGQHRGANGASRHRHGARRLLRVGIEEGERMSITDELRKVAAKTECANGRCEKLYRGDLEHIADRIDAEHEKQCAESWMRGHDAWASIDRSDEMAEHGWVKLPVSEDGDVLHIGELVDEKLPFGGYAAPAPIDTMELSRGAGGYGWMVKLDAENRALVSPKLLRHHEPTVEDVLREFAEGLGVPVADSYIAASAAKLRLAGDAE